ncbi:response regulator [uncultured Methanospirillum sp.]|uniref:ATP-binding response regulator n=1 Tax=uncultured Methanospirillum sp. TaxID=262503 RepID=UPI0029C70034|nr:response regulator [uncultured Methanospirillum sp.]
MIDPVRIVIVEDEFVTGLEIQARLEDLGYEVLAIIDTGEEAVTRAGGLLPDIMIMDITLKGEMNGIEAARIIKNMYGIPVIYLTAHSDEATVQQAVQSEPFGYLIKPLEERALNTTIRMALYKHSMDKALIESEKRYRTIAELSEDAICIINPDLIVPYLNTKSKQVFHLSDTSESVQDVHAVFPTSLLITLEDQIKSVFTEGRSSRVTHHYLIDEEDMWMDCTFVPVLAGEEIIQAIGLLHDISAMVRIEKEIEKKGIIQIEHNMAQFQILNDRIRNPLAIIMSIASMIESKESEDIIDQVKKIDDLVTKLDQGWVQSDVVRTFLIKHYGLGQEI